MDPEQIRAEMKATRERIDRELNRLQTRTIDRQGRTKLFAFAGGALLSMLFVWARRRAKAAHH